MELTREVLEVSAACDRLAEHDACCVCIARHACEDSQEYAVFALSLMDERDRLRMQVKAAEDMCAKLLDIHEYMADYMEKARDERLAMLTAIGAWQITPTEMYYRNEAEMKAAKEEP